MEELLACRRKFETLFAAEVWQWDDYNGPDVLNDIYNHVTGLAAFVFNAEMAGALKDLLGQSMICIPECNVQRNRYINWHRDTALPSQHGHSLKTEQGGLLIQTAIYFQDNGPAGGGITIAPGSHLEKDRLGAMYSKSKITRAAYLSLKKLKLSPFDALDRRADTLDVPTQRGDLLLFNAMAAHRSTFRPARLGEDKYAIYNAFTNDMEIARAYQQSMKTGSNPYARYLRQAALNPEFIAQAQKLGLNWYF